MTRSLAGILLVLMLVITGTPCVASATDIYKTVTTVLSIPDDGSQVWSNINISYSDIVNSGISNPNNTTVTGIDVTFTSNHERSQDLEVYLQYSSYGQNVNSYYSLWNHEGGTAPNPTKTVNGVSHFNGLPAKGDWTLYVKDTAPGATGNITSWQIKVYYTSASGSGSTTYSVNPYFLDALTSGHDENSDGYMEDYQFFLAFDIAAPAGVKVYAKTICNTTRDAWTGGDYINNDHNVQIWNQSYLLSRITQNSTLNFNVELWDDNSYSHTLLASALVAGNPIKVGVGYFPDGYVSNWVPGSDIDADGYYDTYQIELGIEGLTFAGPKDVYAKIICTTTGQTWWASAPWTISDVSNYHYFNFTESDFAGHISNDTTLSFLVELWDTTKTTKLGSTANNGQIYTTGILKVEGSPCSVSVNNFTATNSIINPSAGDSTLLTASVIATPAANWQLNINNENIASGNTSSVSQTWYGKNLAGTILAPGTYTATLTATDASSQCTVSKSIPLTIVDTYPSLQITTTSLPAGAANTSYSETLSANGGKTPYYWTLFSGNLPTGLSLDPLTGVISGTPSTSGSFTIKVTDNQSPTPATATTTQPLIIDFYSNLTITSTSIPAGASGTFYSNSSQPLSATGGNGTYIWSISSGSLPDGLGLNTTTGVISGIPADVGNFTFTIQVSDSQNSPPASKLFTLIITNSQMQNCIESSTAVAKEASSSVCIGSTADVITGIVDHDQELFTTKGGTQNIAISLFYKSLPAYNGSMGIGWSHSYDIFLIINPDNGSIVLKKGNGDKKYYTKNGSIYDSPPGDFSVLTAVSGGYKITYRDGSCYNFNSVGKITSIADRLVNEITFDYTGGNLTITDPAYRTATIVYNQTTTPPRITTITDPANNVYVFSYEGNNLSRITNPAATIGAEQGYWAYEYHPNGMLQSKRDPNGYTSQYSYYPDNRMQTATDPNARTRTIVYPTTTDILRTSTLTEKDGGQWLYTYDSQTGAIKQKTDPNGKPTIFYYYPNGFIKAKTEPKDGAIRITTFFSYDSYGNLLIETDPVDVSIYSPSIDPETVSDVTTLASKTPPIKAARHYTYGYDIIPGHYDRINAITDERGTTTLATTFAYSTDSYGEVVTATATPGNYATTTKKNSNGSVREIIDANGKTSSFTYHADSPSKRTDGIVGLPETVTVPDATSTSLTSYDKKGNPLTASILDSTGATKLSHINTFDNLGRMSKLRKSSSTLGSFDTDYSYDLAGNLTSVIDAEQHETKYAYNYNRQVAKITDAKLNDTIFTYSGSEKNGVDKLIGVYDANVAKNTPLTSQPHTSYDYDKLGRLDTEIDPLGKKIHFTYYDNGLLKEKYDATSATPGTLLVTFVYNSRGQITDKTFTDNTYEHYTYTANGQLQTAANQNISYTYAYYTDGRLQSVTDTINNRQIYYDLYDNLGQHKQVTILKGAGADQRTVSYDYDTANRPWHITSTAGAFTYGYDSSGRRNTLVYPNNTRTTWNYDDLNNLTTIVQVKYTYHHGWGWSYYSYDPFASFGYTHDRVGNRLTKTGTVNETYGYDELYRLLSVTASKSESFTYDPAGNRLTGSGATDASYQSNVANQMTQGRKLTYGYDNRGNQSTKTVPGATDKTWIRTWDYNNRLIKEEKVKGTEVKTVTYKYDPFGRRIEKKFVQTKNVITETETTTYVYNNEDIVLELFTTASGTEKTYYTHASGIDEPLALERSGVPFYFHQDGLGSITNITSPGSLPYIYQSYTYDAYGMATPSTDFRNSYQYAGYIWDWETGTYHVRERGYDPMEGVLTSKDPIGMAGGDTNLYRYVEGQPINFVDPSGLSRIDPGGLFERPFAGGGGISSGAGNLAARSGGSASATATELSAAAKCAANKVGSGRGPVYGTKVHSAFEPEVKALGRNNLAVEQSYLNGELVPRGTRGSVRADVIEGPLYSPTAIYDLKTGSATLTPARIRQLQQHILGGPSNVPILEIRP